MRAPKRSLRNRGPIGAASAEPEAGASVERLRRDLERRGVAPALARPVAARIAARAGKLGPDAYAAFLDGVAAAAAHSAPGADPRAEAGALEIQRLVQDFAIELKKLDEGLRMLSSYLLRIRDRAGSERRVVH